MTVESIEALEQVSRIVAGVTLSVVFLAGYGVSWYVYRLNTEETYHQKLAFCHERMQNSQTRYIWRQEYCGKTLDAVDPISVKPVAGIIEEK